MVQVFIRSNRISSVRIRQVVFIGGFFGILLYGGGFVCWGSFVFFVDGQLCLSWCCMVVLMCWWVLVQLVQGLLLVSLLRCCGRLCRFYWLVFCSELSFLWNIGIDIGNFLWVCIEQVVMVLVLWLLCRQLMKILLIWLCGLEIVEKCFGIRCVKCWEMVWVKFLILFQLCWCFSGISRCMFLLLLVLRKVCRFSLLSNVRFSWVVLSMCFYGSVGFGLRLRMKWLGCFRLVRLVFQVWNLMLFICIVLISVLVLWICNSGG